LFATALHLFGDGSVPGVAVPPHMGNCLQPQSYPVLHAPIMAAHLLAVDPIADLAILATDPQPNVQVPQIPTIVAGPPTMKPGTEVVVLGYPFAPIGSLLETWNPTYIIAIARRALTPSLFTDELVIGSQSHPGMSGAAVVGKNDGVLYGVLRGTLAPPETLRIGDIPIATDTSVTFATSAHLLHDLLDHARSSIDTTQ
jgi:S1-C subfamily serine protease